MNNKTLDGRIIPGTILQFLLLLTFTIKSTAQNNGSNRTTPFDTGIRLENTGVLIPWGIQPSELTKISNPKIDTLDRRTLNVHWDSVTFCGGLKAFIKYNPKKKRNGDYSKLFYVYVSFDNADFEKVVQYCTANIYTASRKLHEKHPQYIWSTGKILVQVTRGQYFTLLYIARDPDSM